VKPEIVCISMILNCIIQRYNRTRRPLSFTVHYIDRLHLISLLTNTVLRYLHQPMQPEIRYTCISIILNYVIRSYNRTPRPLSLTLPGNDRLHSSHCLQITASLPTSTNGTGTALNIDNLKLRHSNIQSNIPSSRPSID
jgi:hypothetical protein